MKNLNANLNLILLLAFMLIINASIAQDAYDPSTSVDGYDEAKELLQTDQAKPTKPNDSPLLRSAAANNCPITIDNSFTAAARNDDGWTGPIALPFGFDLYGTTYNSVYINTNGNLTFVNGVSQFSASGFPFGTPMVAPFWGDVDTRNAACGQAWYKVNPTNLIVKWDMVGYYNQQCNLVNTFSVVISTLSDPLTGVGNNVLFAYEDMQWTTGSASGGVGGFGGVPATVGINAGNNVDFVQIGRFNQNNSNYDGGGGNDDGVHYLDNQCFFFNVGNAENIPPSVSGLPTGNTINVNVDETASELIQFLPPEINQTVSVSFQENGTCGTTVTATNGAVGNLQIDVDPALGGCSAPSSSTIDVTVTDDGTPIESIYLTITINILPVNQAPVAKCKFLEVFIDPNNPDVNAPGSKDIWLIPSDDFDGGSTSSSANPAFTTRRRANYLSFDWTTQGACEDGNPNGTVNNKDRGKTYRDCLPTSQQDFNRTRWYLLKVTDEFGVSTCKQRYKVIPSANNEYVRPILMVKETMTGETIQNTNESDNSQTALQNSVSTNLGLTVFPNPGNESIQLEWNAAQSGPARVEFISFSGARVFNLDVNVSAGQNQLYLNTERLAFGSYVIRISQNDQHSVLRWSKL